MDLPKLRQLFTVRSVAHYPTYHRREGRILISRKIIATASWGGLFPLLLVAIVAIVGGACVRVAHLAASGVDHFDEGVYVATLPPDERGRTSYPMRHLYAPPLVPSLHAFAAWSTGDASWSPMMIGVLAGCLTPLAIGWLGYRWFGPLAGAIAATLAATSDLHAAFSRSALTDSPLLLLVLLALAALEPAFRTGRSAPILIAGALTGIGWWIKYNGWLPLAIGAAALTLKSAADLLVTRRQASSQGNPRSGAEPRRRSEPLAPKAEAARAEGVPWKGQTDLPRVSGVAEVPAWGAAVAVAAIAGIAFAAQLYLLSADGDRYADIAANHRRYVVGPLGWFGSLSRQAANLAWFDGGLTTIAGPLLVAGMQFRRRGFHLAVGLSIGSLILGTFPVLLGAAVVWGWLVARDAWQRPEQLTWGTCITAAWVGGLFVATPNYTPYARLALPLVAALWLVAGALLARASSGPGHSILSMRAGIVLAVVWMAVVAVRAPTLLQRGMPAWRDRTDLRRAASLLVDRALATTHTQTRTLDGPGTRLPVGTTRPQAVFLTYGEPAVYYLLSRESRFRDPAGFGIAPTGDVPRANAADCPVFLIAGPHAGQDEAMTSAANRLQLVAEATFQLSDLPLLDLRDARTLDPSASARSATLHCYQLTR